MMTRNTERRVEIAYPVLDPTCRALVTTFVNIQLADNVKARQLTAEGTWEKVPREKGEPPINSQEVLLALARVRAHAKHSEVTELTPFSRIEKIPHGLAQALSSLPATGGYDHPHVAEKLVASIDPTSETTARITEREEKRKEEEAKAAEEAKKAVYISKAGKKYHTKDCRYTGKSSKKVTRAEAIEMGKKPCNTCHPDGK